MELLTIGVEHGTAYYKSWSWNCLLQELIMELLTTRAATRAGHGTIELIMELLDTSTDHGIAYYKS
jgi:hypothetical protein